MEKYKMYTMLMTSLGLMLLVVGASYSFFNYTKTGAINNLGTGTINFSSSEGPTLNVTNYFPMTSSETAEADLDSITISISGNTTYADGEEFMVSIEAIDSNDGRTRIPVSYIATYTPTTNNTIGTSSNDYWNERNNKDANIYTLNSTGVLFDGSAILTGYIDDDGTGINGELTIKAYIDSDKIAISDTYSPYVNQHIVNPNMTQEELNTCASFMNNTFRWRNYFPSGTTGLTFCQGTGHLWGKTFQESLRRYTFTQSEINYLVEHNIIYLPSYTDDTTSEWVNGRVVVTTEEWNSYSTNPISFKVKVESNEGIWAGTIDSCPNCKFWYVPDVEMYMVDNNWDQPATTLTTDLHDNYIEVINASGKNYFIGLRENDLNQVTDAYVCNIKNGVPYCLYSNSDSYETYKELLQRVWNNTCTAERSGSNNQYEKMTCGGMPNYTNNFFVTYWDDSYVQIGIGDDTCFVDDDRRFVCWTD